MPTNAELADQVKGLRDELEEVKEIMNGNGKLGLTAKVEILWRFQTALISAVSALGGAIVAYVVAKTIG